MITIEVTRAEAALLAGGDFGAAMQIMPTLQQALQQAVSLFDTRQGSTTACGITLVIIPDAKEAA